MKRTIILLLSITVLGLVVNQHAQNKQTSKEQPTKEQPSNQQPQILADQITFAGHGMLFDIKLKQIKLDPGTILKMQDSIMQLVLKEKSPYELMTQDKTVLKQQQLLKQPKLSTDERILINSEVLERLLEAAPQNIQTRYSWRNKALLNEALQRRYAMLTTLSPEVRDALRLSGFFTPAKATTDYIEDCRSHEVPIPPDWAESGTDWVRQGTLATNLLSPGRPAAVWTYSDPARRGACIALPREDGSVGSVAGIICQSATTGHACFWDNKLRSVEPEQFMGWSGLTLVIAELRDPTNLQSQPCTGCHHGNNVYLMSPDDPTWAKVLRGPLSGVRTLTFTTRVETSTDNQGGRPRYIPITGGRLGWENSYSPVTGFCAGCHEYPNLAVAGAGPLRMPPGCASPSTSDPSRCYGTP